MNVCLHSAAIFFDLSGFCGGKILQSGVKRYLHKDIRTDVSVNISISLK